mgnify:CR=1 FL=1
MSQGANKDRLKGHHPSEIRYQDVYEEMAEKYLAGDPKKPNEFVATVRLLVTHNDRLYSNIDPFYDEEIDKERMFDGGTIKKPVERVVAYVEVGELMEMVSNMRTKEFAEVYTPLIRVDVTPESPSKRSVVVDEQILITFSDLQSLKGPKFSRFIHKTSPKIVDSKKQPKEKEEKNIVDKAKKSLQKCPKGPGNAIYSDVKKRCSCNNGYWWNGAKCYCPKKKGSGKLYVEVEEGGTMKCVAAKGQ